MLFFREKSEAERLRKLKAIRLFQDLTTKELLVLEDLLHERIYLKDEVIFDEGEEGQGLFIIMSGKVRILRNNQMVVEFLPGNSFGELALLENAPRVAQARAIEDSRILGLFRQEFFSLLNSHQLIASKISLQLARQISHRLRESVMGMNQSGSL